MKREQIKVVDDKTMIDFMRFNDFQNDPEAIVEGCDKPIPAGSVANRLDLTLPGDVSWSRLTMSLVSITINCVTRH